MPFVDGLGVHQAVSVEKFGGTTKGCGVHELFPVVHAGVGEDVGFGRIHPPGIEAQGKQVLFHLLPVQFPGVGVVGIVERTQVAAAYPVTHAVFDGLLVHPTLVGQFLEMFRAQVELRPDRNHDVCRGIVDFLHHGLGVGEAFQVEFVAAPGVLWPVGPVLDDVVDGNLQLSEGAQGGKQLVLCFVAFPALPVAHGPLGHDLGFSGQNAVPAHHFIGRIAGNEIVIQLTSHFRPQRQSPLFCFRTRTQGFQSQVGGAPVGQPFNLEGVFALSRQLGGKRIMVRVPGRAPPFSHHQLPVNPDLGVPGVIQIEPPGACRRRLDEAFPGDSRVVEAELFGKLLDLLQILVVDAGFQAFDKHACAVGQVGGRESAFVALFVEQTELVQVAVGPGVSEAGQGTVVPQ